MVDMDLFFLQICATQLPASFFLSSCIDSFSVGEWFFQNLTSSQEMEHDSMMEGMLTFLSTLVTSRTNLGNDEDMKCIVEISALLTTSDKTHSQLLELMPERSGNPYAKNFEKYLKLLSSYRPPPVGSENLEQGLFIPLPIVWKIYYDPLHVLLRAVHRRDFQNSMDRFSAFVRQQNLMPKSGNLWPPFRLPNSVGQGYSDPATMLNSKVFHSMILGILYRAVHVRNVSEHLMALAIFLLELAVGSASNCKENDKAALETNAMDQNETPELFTCYPSNSLFENLVLHVNTITSNSIEHQNSPANYQTQFDSDIEWELSEGDAMPMLIGSVDHDYTSYNQGSMDIALPQDLSIVRENSLNEDFSPPLPTRLPLMAPDTAVVEYNSPPSTASSQQQQLVPAINASPSSSTNMELVRPTRSPQELFYSSNQINHTTNSISTAILPFNRVQPVAVQNTTLDIVPNSAGGNAGGAGNRRRIRTQESQDAIKIDDSIISLLLKLHSQLSGTLDSFSLDDLTHNSETNDDDDDDDESSMDQEPESSQQQQQQHQHFPNSIEPRIGDGPFFIGNLLRKIARADENCASSINEIRQRLWPNQRERQAEQQAREAKEKEERSTRARERQQKLMEEFATRQKQFMATEGELKV